MDRDTLIAELEASAIKHNPDEILRIAKKPDGTIVFLENGNAKSGWQHIREKHANEFANRGISQDQIPDAIMAAVINGIIVGMQAVV